MAKAPKARSAKSPSSRTPRTTKRRAGKVPATDKRTATKKAAASGKRAKRSAGTTVMGMTVPKTVTNALDALVNSPRGREILGSALVAAATAAAAALVKNPETSGAATKARDAANEAGDQVATATRDLSQAAAGALADIVTGAARSLLPTV